MNTRWFKNISTSKKEARKKEILSYRNAFDELRKLLEEDLEEYVPDYSVPSWSHKQADVNGANRKLRQIIDLITIKETS